MNKKILITSGVIIVALILGFVAWKAMRHFQRMSQTSEVTPTSRALLPKEVTVILSKNGFSPNQVTIHVGSAIVWKNESGANQTVNSDNYPTNQLHKELNFGVFNTNSSVVYIFKTPGTYGYHNQFNPQQKGTVIVEK